MDGTDYSRPRRPTPETLSYLRSLPFDEKLAHEEIVAYVNNQALLKTQNEDETEQTIDYPQILSASLAALDEIKYEIASLAGDEFGSQCIETIARISAPYSVIAARKLLHGISGYMIHLSTHRYGSHVVQTILQSILEPAKIDSDINLQEVLELDQEEANDLPSLKDLILSVAEELQPVSKDLAVHICGSHVLRSLICILGGIVEKVPPHLMNKRGTLDTGGARRGKVKGKKSKKKKPEDGSSGVATNNATHVEYDRIIDGRINASDSNIQDSLNLFISELTNMDPKLKNQNIPKLPGTLQHLACNPSACPLLIVLMRILTLKDSEGTSTRVKYDAERAKSDFLIGIHIEENHFKEGSSAENLAKHLLCWDENNLEQSGDIIYGLSGEPRGSHLLEVLLRISNDFIYDKICRAGKFLEPDVFAEYASHDVSNFVIQTVLNTARTRSQVESFIKCIDPLITNGYVLDNTKKRRGIFWRAVEMSAKFRIGQETILNSMRKGFSMLNNEDDMSVDDCIPKLLDLKLPDSEKASFKIDSTGARIVYHLLRFVPRLCSGVIDGIFSNYGSVAIEAMCNDGLASRCIIDGILDGPIKQKPFSQALTHLQEKLTGRWVELSLERVGHHCVKKIFTKLHSIDDKLLLTKEIAVKINRLGGNAMGRSVLSECAVKDFLESEDVWRSTIKKRIEKEQFVDELIDGNIQSDKKRKRKRKKS